MATKYTKEIKDKVLQLLSEGVSAADIFFATKVSTTTIYRWQREIAESSRESNTTITEVREMKNEITELRETVKLLEDEIEELKNNPKPEQTSQPALSKDHEDLLGWLNRNCEDLGDVILYVKQKRKEEQKANDRYYMETGEIRAAHPIFDKFKNRPAEPDPKL